MDIENLVSNYLDFLATKGLSGLIVDVVDNEITTYDNDADAFFTLGYEVKGDDYTFDEPELWVQVPASDELLQTVEAIEAKHYLVDELEAFKLQMRNGFATKSLNTCQAKAMKMIDPETRTFGMYATVWGERDCQNEVMQRPAIEKYMGKGTPLMLWEHGLNPEFGSNTVGKWFSDRFKVDDFGLWVEGQIGHDEWGNKAWDKLQETKSIGGSVGSIWYLVKKDNQADGTRYINDWPLLEISVMCGTKQCVPSAKAAIKSEDLLLPVAVKMGIDVDLNQNERGTEMSITKEDLQEMVAATIKKMEEEKEQEMLEEEEEEERVTAKAAEMLADNLPEIRSELREEITAELKADLVKEVTAQVAATYETKISQLSAQLEAAKSSNTHIEPVTHMGNGGQAAVAIKVGSKYDRLSTLELSLRHEILRSYGKNPSERFVRALEDRVKELAYQHDTVSIKGGEPVKVPALDFTLVGDSDIDISKLTEQTLATKGMNRFGQNAGFDANIDPITRVGTEQLAFIAAKANELNYTTQAGAGDEWVPTLMSLQLAREIRQNAAVLGLFQQFDMPSQPYDWPKEGADPVFYKVGETQNEVQLILTGSPFTDSKMGTAKTTFSAGKLGAISYWSEEMTEDTLLAFEPQVSDQFGLAMSHAIEYILINGDERETVANINIAGDTPTGNERYLILDGLRRMAQNDSAGFDAGTLEFADFITGRSKLGRNGVYGVNPSQLVYLGGPGVYFKALTLDEVVTVDKLGTAATILKGQLASIGGVPFVVSENFVLTDATGLVDGLTPGNNIKGELLTVRKDNIRVGWKRRPRVRIVGLPGSDARYIVGSARFDMQEFFAGSVSNGYNITL